MVVIKNYDPFVSFPEFAIATLKDLSNFRNSLNSSSNSFCQMLCPPVPLLLGSPVYI